jgi:hypothetical protein
VIKPGKVNEELWKTWNRVQGSSHDQRNYAIDVIPEAMATGLRGTKKTSERTREDKSGECKSVKK